METLSQVMSRLRHTLSPKLGEREAASVVRFIFEQLKDWNAVDVAIRADEPVSDFVVAQADDAVRRVLADEPVQYVFGHAHFYGMEFDVTPATLIPRPETAMLVDMIVKDCGNRPDQRVLDLGTGSGCIAIALARNLRFPQVTAVDISPEALVVARANAERLHARVTFVEGDILSHDLALKGEYDLIVSNPPYIAESERAEMDDNVLRYEPATALFVPDDDPLRFYRAIGSIAAKRLTPGGWLWLEINPRFATELVAMLRAQGLEQVEIIKDMEGRDRFVSARKTDE